MYIKYNKNLRRWELWHEGVKFRYAKTYGRIRVSYLYFKSNPQDLEDSCMLSKHLGYPISLS